MTVLHPPQPYSCETICGLLGLHLDGECSPGDAQRVRDHLSGCPCCASEYAALVALQSRLRKVADDERAPASLWSKVSDRLHRAEASSLPPAAVLTQPPTRRWMLWGASAAGACAVAVGARLVSPPLSVNPVIAEPVQDFITFRLSGRTEDLSSTDTSALARWAETRTTFAMPPIRPNIGDYKLAGGRLCWLLDRRLAGISYVHGDEKAVVYIMDGAGLSIPRATDSAAAEANITIHHYKGHGVAVWREHDLVHVLVARNDTLDAIQPALSNLVRGSRRWEPKSQANHRRLARPPPDSG